MAIGSKDRQREITIVGEFPFDSSRVLGVEARKISAAEIFNPASEKTVCPYQVQQCGEVFDLSIQGCKTCFDSYQP